MDKNKQKYIKELHQIGLLTTLPFIMVAGPLLGFWVGSWVDQKWQTEPYAKAILIMLGFLGSAKEVVRMIKEAQALQK